jgi:hypothetical protein
MFLVQASFQFYTERRPAKKKSMASAAASAPAAAAAAAATASSAAGNTIKYLEFVDNDAPPPNLVLSQRVFKSVFADKTNDEPMHLVFETEDGQEVYRPRLTNYQLESRARARIIERRRLEHEARRHLDSKHSQVSTPSATTSAPAASAAAAAAAGTGARSRQQKRSRSDALLGYDVDNDDDYDDDDMSLPRPRAQVSSPSSSSAVAVDARGMETTISMRELEQELTCIREEMEGMRTRAQILRAEAAREHARRKELQEQELRRLRQRDELIEDEGKEARQLYRRRYSAVPFLDGLDSLAERLKAQADDDLRQKMSDHQRRASGIQHGCVTERIDPGERAYQLLQDNIRLVAMANNFEYSSMQLIFMDEFSRACAPLVYGKHWNGGTSAAFLQREQLREHNPFVLAMTPRRFGKTWAVVAFLLALAMTAPDLRILVYSQNARTSQHLVAKIKAFAAGVKALKDGRWTDRFPGGSKDQVTVIPLDISFPPGTGERKLQSAAFHGSTIRAVPCTLDGTFFLFFLSLFLEGGGAGRERKSAQERVCIYKRTEKVKIYAFTVSDVATFAVTAGGLGLTAVAAAAAAAAAAAGGLGFAAEDTASAAAAAGLAGVGIDGTGAALVLAWAMRMALSSSVCVKPSDFLLPSFLVNTLLIEGFAFDCLASRNAYVISFTSSVDEPKAELRAMNLQCVATRSNVVLSVPSSAKRLIKTIENSAAANPRSDVVFVVLERF